MTHRPDKFQRWNPVHKDSEQQNRPKTIDSKKDKRRRGESKYPKQDIMKEIEDGDL